MKLRIMCGTFFAACAASAGALTMPQTTPRGGSPVLTFASLRDVTVTDDFWAPRYERWRTKTIPDVLAKLCGRSRIEANFRLAAVGARKGHVGPYFYDGLLYETIRGAADYLVREPDASLEKRLDALIDLIVSAQCPDGYLNTRVQVSDPSQRWGDNGGCALDQHEIYNAGCLVEAGLHYYRATGKAKLLGAGIRFANLLCDTIGPTPKRNIIPTHSLAEEALVSLAELLRTDPAAASRAGVAAKRPEDYLALIGFWFANHGNNCGAPDWEKLGSGAAVQKCKEMTRTPHGPEWRPSWGDYQMDRRPLADYRSIEGHAVRATLLGAGLAAYAVAADDRDCASLATRFWESMVGRKMYISGGVGADAGLERFVADWQLPPDAYLETCAAVGSAFFSARMAALTGEGRSFDEIERVAYNALLTAVGANGVSYTYKNPLNTRKGERWDWHGCPCCPPMVLKLTGMLPSYAYAKDATGYRVNLFMGGAATFSDTKSGRVRLVQETRYPADGVVRVRVEPERSARFALRIRIPGWARGVENPFGLYVSDARLDWSVRLNGATVANVDVQNGYAVFDRDWRTGDTVELRLDVRERLVRAAPQVKDVAGCVARMRGPVLLARENGAWIPYADVANKGPAPHEVWVRENETGMRK